jgi:hypothetical protein
VASLEIDVAKLFVVPNWSDTMKGHKLQLLKHQCTCHTVSIHKPSYGWPNHKFHLSGSTYNGYHKHWLNMYLSNTLCMVTSEHTWSFQNCEAIIQDMSTSFFFPLKHKTFSFHQWGNFLHVLKYWILSPNLMCCFRKGMRELWQFMLQFTMKVNLKREKDN